LTPPSEVGVSIRRLELKPQRLVRAVPLADERPGEPLVDAPCGQGVRPGGQTGDARPAAGAGRYRCDVVELSIAVERDGRVGYGPAMRVGDDGDGVGAPACER
jgi:hypothetical protein